MIKLFEQLLDALLPEDCVVCERPLVEGERFLCLACSAAIPGLEVNDFTDNAVHETLASTHPVDKAAALFRYRRGSPYTRLIHYAKYNGRPHMARFLGQRLGMKLRDTGFFNGIEALVPVPLNGWRMIKRGYNQSAEIAKGISVYSGIPVVGMLKARRHSTQTFKGAAGRRANAKGIFLVKDVKTVSAYNHIALVDDVITTGSTMLECAEAIRQAVPGIKISVLAAALTEL